MKITIHTNPKLSIPRMLTSAALEVGVIGIGVAVGSTAMQWAGFAALILLAFGVVAVSRDKNEGISIAQARARLDEIEAREKAA